MEHPLTLAAEGRAKPDGSRTIQKIFPEPARDGAHDGAAMSSEYKVRAILHRPVT